MSTPQENISLIYNVSMEMEIDESQIGNIESSDEAGRQIEISPDATLEKLNDPSYLPSHEDIVKAFSGENSGKWRDFCDRPEHRVFELLNQEYIHSLAKYLLSNIYSIQNDDEPVTILEIAAGDGRLTHFLQEELDRKAPGKAKIVAADDQSWNINPNFPVEKIDNQTALARFQPQMVICSWMPYETDFSQEIRSTKSVDSYILIGESGGATGDEWLTWGRPKIDWDADEDDEEDRVKTPPYETDGFQKEILSDMSDLQISRLSQPPNFDSSTDNTVIFSRQK